jgi:hypothetical protein
VRYQLSNTKKAGVTTTVYFQQMKGYADTMASLGHPLMDEEILDYMLAGLGAEYKSLVASITMRDDPISLNNLVGDIQSLINVVGRQPADPCSGPPTHGGFGRGGQGCSSGGQGRGSGGRGC